MPQGEPLNQELAVLQDFGLQLPDFEKHRKLTSGTRRPLAVWLDHLECSSDPHGVRLGFTLPSGAYATVVLRELMKVEVAGETSGEI
jgi:tRNA pseudouridine13 synthase